MNAKDLPITVDFAGRTLCRTCWDGVHWRHDPITKALINNCELWVGNTHCECECKNVEFYKREERAKSREIMKQEREVQMRMGGGWIEVK